MKNFRLGLIGCGGMMKNHTQAISECKGVELTAFCDIVIERAEEFQKDIAPNAYVTKDWKTMADYVDGVLIALPHDLHYECGIFFARKHKHILMEKPLCNTEEECVRLIEACEAEKVTLMCAYPVRYYPGIVKLRELINSGEYGEIIQMSIYTEQLTKREETHWSHTARLGGGQLFSHGCHYIDILLWFLGEPDFGTHVGTKVGVPWLMQEGTSAVTIKFKNGAVGYHGATWGARGTRMYYDIQIHTEAGMFDYDFRFDRIVFYNGNKAHDPSEKGANQQAGVIWDADINGAGKKHTEHEIQHFLDCCRTGEKPLTDGRSALQGLRVIWELYKAEKWGTVADLNGLGLPE